MPSPTPASSDTPGQEGELKIPARRKRPARRQFAEATLALEAFVVLFATLAAFGLRAAPAGIVWAFGGTLFVVLLALSRMVGRPGGYVAGSVAQVLVLAMGLVVPMMFVVGGVFVVLWVVALRLGKRIDRERAEWDIAHGVAPDPSA